jgi:hypothetical protein
MKLRHFLFAASLAVTASQARAADFSDTSIGVRDAPYVANVGGDPGNEKGSRDVNKLIFNVQHFDVWDYGTNFFNVDALLSNPNEAAYNSSGGSTEFYAVYRAQLSPDKIFGLNTKFGPISAINFEIGGDLESENTQFAPNKKLFVVGPNFHFDLGKGFLNVGVHYSKEWNHNGFCADACAKPGGPVSFDAAPEAEFVWLYDLKSLIGLPVTFNGFMNIVGPKGKDGFGGQTFTEILAVPRLSLDLGTLMGGKAHKPDVYLAAELWEHKFGASDKTAGSEEVTPEIGVELHF